MIQIIPNRYTHHLEVIYDMLIGIVKKDEMGLLLVHLSDEKSRLRAALICFTHSRECAFTDSTLLLFLCVGVSAFEIAANSLCASPIRFVGS
jgi:hypothetical protein